MESSDKYQQEDVTLLLSYLKAITSLVMHAAEAETLGEVLERIAEASRQLVRARYAAMGVPDGKGGLEYFMFTGIDKAQAHAIGGLPEGRGLLGAIMSEREPIRLEHIKDDPRSVGFPPNHPHMDRFLGVPIIVGELLFGMLYLADRYDGRPFTEQDQWLIETMAGYAALAIAGARLREQRERLTLLEERERIGMELHDGVIQSLYAIGMQLQLMHATRKMQPDDLLPVMDNLNNVIEDIRGYIQNLKSRNYQQKTILECLDDMVNRLHIPQNLKVEIDVPEGEMPFLPTTYEALYQMANEALSNVIRHANATMVRLSAHQQNGIFQLVIEDNGRGFAVNDPSARAGLGLRNIQQRARLHGGTVHIDSERARGTRIVFSLPVNR
jgi:signal transduction histidine kinase